MTDENTDYWKSFGASAFGMDIKLYVATAAMQAILSNPNFGEMSAYEIAMYAYDVADEMERHADGRK